MTLHELRRIAASMGPPTHDKFALRETISLNPGTSNYVGTIRKLTQLTGAGLDSEVLGRWAINPAEAERAKDVKQLIRDRREEALRCDD